MKRSKYTDEQILAIVKEGEAGRKVALKSWLGVRDDLRNWSMTAA